MTYINAIVPTQGSESQFGYTPAVGSDAQDSVNEAIQKIQDPALRDKLTNIVENLKKFIADGSGADQIFDEINAAFSSEEETGSAGEVGGFDSTILAIVEWIEKINAAQAVLSKLAGSLAQNVIDLSDAQNVALKEDAKAIHDHPVSTEGTDKDLIDLQTKFSTDQKTFDNYIATPKAKAESDEQIVRNLGQTSTSGFSECQSIMQLKSNLASILMRSGG